MKPASILIVEDDFIVARMLEKTLSELGYHVVGMASTGEDALVMTREHRPSLVLLDIRLGEKMDGIETAGLIHEQYHIPVVYLTAYSDDQTFNRAIGTSLYWYLIKPVTLNALRTTIEVALEKFRIEESLRQANRKLNLLSSMTRHDIINTLTALMTAVDLAKVKAKNRAFIEHLDRESRLLSQIHSQIEFTRDYETLGTDAPVWHTIRTLVESTARQILPPTIKAVTSVQDLRILADPLLERVIYNLMDNAVRHGGNITTIRFDSEERENGLVLICEDDGDGISMDEKEKIFDRGFGKNTGLGLFLVREILGITGITITETGTPGKGARFEILIPTGMYRT